MAFWISGRLWQHCDVLRGQKSRHTEGMMAWSIAMMKVPSLHTDFSWTNHQILFTTTLHEGENTKIYLKQIESSAMESVLQYIYTRQIDLNYDNVLEVMRTADYFCIDGLVELCHWYLVECLGPDNCVKILQFSDDYYFGPLGDAAFRYIVKEFMTVAEQGDELMNLTQGEFKRIIEDSQLNVKREEFVWDVLLQWVDMDPENRKNDLVHLLPMVRFGLMDSKYFIDNVIYAFYCKMYLIHLNIH
ncbi:BTB/POZ domain,SKP1/BTB/POZ domain,BTB/Kelch-associated [Cinara cedri]|uniref:BTB/POZ domain,SKP1/BTB/POZ domain,BTB/Kelch-associated n=1 Tax=Cinara cedri TaxID=506608 RepID=A0A5E4NGK8_9HEMI|nr:BTB/POZ domain,SKP1/BTB/POZ domain,BTB/Kelch-associated [Cinara cedri]